MGYKYRRAYDKYGNVGGGGCLAIIGLWIVCIIGIALPPLGVLFLIIFLATRNWKKDF